MYIKQVVIEGFKSYREQIATETFSSKVNCVVGANGSGKSNFFHAIRFVISDLFHNLRNEERQALLHEGAGHQVLSAFVEIVFDNSDNRIPVDKEEVRLRRTIGVKKDEYFLDGKHITKTEVMNLLESAGFSRSNPYYVVQQGKIASLTLMKDSERLDLLKEIGGTRVYEERRRESLKIMQETGNKRKQIIQVVQYLDDRLRELDEEKEELRKYQQLDRQRKSLEYSIYDKELHDAKQQLMKIEEDRYTVSEKSAMMYNSVSEAHEQCKKLDKSLKDLTKDIQSSSREKETIEKQRTDAIKKRAKLELDDKDLQDKIKGNIKAKVDAVKQLELLEREIQESNAELTKIKQLYDQQVREEENLARGIMEREKQLSILYQKQGRATQFANKAARDQWLKKEIKDYEQVLSSNQVQEKKLRDEIEQLNVEIREQDDYIKGRRDEAAKLESLISGYRQGYNQFKAERDRLHDERKSLWGKESELSSEVDRLKSEVVKAEKSLDHATPGDIRRGLNSVRRICDQHGIGGVYGPIIELLECDEKYFTAVEVTAGNSLFHVVVENDDISTKIIGHLNAQKGGRVTFVPLNRVKAPEVTYPQSSDVIPLLRKMKFLEKYRSAFGQVFAKTVICRDIDVATRVARTDGLDCITLEGDQVNKKGGMTGGFYDYRRSKMKFISTIRENMKSIKMNEEDLSKIREELQKTDQKINELVAEQQKNDAKMAHEKSLLEQLKQDAMNAEKQKHSILKSLEKKEKLLFSILTQIDQNRANIAMKEAEMGTELVDHLTPEEKESLSRLNPEITNLKEQLITCKSNRMETETRKQELEMNLSTNLVRRKEELEAVKQSTETEMLQVEAELKKQELADANLLIDQLNQQLKRITEIIDQKNRELENVKVEKDRLKSLEDEYQTTMQDEAKELEQLLSKKNIYLAKQEEYSKKIRELGPLSSDAFETYKRKSIKELYKQLHRCNEQLQQFSHVNKKALDQYVNFTEQREELQKRQAELDAGDEKIKELISVLDMRKDESSGSGKWRHSDRWNGGEILNPSQRLSNHHSAAVAMASLAVPSASVKDSSAVPSVRMPPFPRSQALRFTSIHHNSLSYSAAPKTPLAVSEKASLSPINSSSPKRTGPIVVIDNYDSFTYNLCQYMGELGCEFEVYRNDELTVDELKGKNPRGVLISPGPGTPQDSGISLQTVLELGPTVPLFGVCMGLQCIGEAFGGKIVRSPYGVVHGKSSLVYYNESGEDGLFMGLSNPFTAGRYHSLVIEKESFPSDVLEITAWTEDGLIMAARHKVYRHLQGVQFHPESIITNEGKTIVQNFIKVIERKEAESEK